MNQSNNLTVSGQRNTNVELLRLLAMFLVLMVHADYWSLGEPTFQEVRENFLPSMTRIVIEAISIVCVNVFIFISGWFTIKPTLKGFGNFIFQCLYFLFAVYFIMVATGQASLSWKGIGGCFNLNSWFIMAYIGLYILSPVLNLFVEKASKRQLGIVVASFYIFQTIYGGEADFIVHGYSTFSFIGLYLLAQYIRRYVKDDYKSFGGWIFIGALLLNSAAALTVISRQAHVPLMTYDNPLVVLGAVGLFLFFNGLQIKYSSVINFVAKSSFAVFLLHTDPNIGEPIYKPLCKTIFDSYSGVECLAVFLLVLIGIYLLAILLDMPRRYIWKWLSGSKKL